MGWLYFAICEVLEEIVRMYGYLVGIFTMDRWHIRRYRLAVFGVALEEMIMSRKKG